MNGSIKLPSIFFSVRARKLAKKRSRGVCFLECFPQVERLRKTILLGLCLSGLAQYSFAIGRARYVEVVPRPGSFTIVHGKTLAGICVDPSDYKGVVRAAGDLQADVARVTGHSPKFVGVEANNVKVNLGTNTIVVGTIGKNAVIDRLIREQKIDVTAIAGKWESFLIQVVPHPTPGVEIGLIIAGSDKRGTIYGIYDLSEQIGVSPWYWWSDVPVAHKDALFVKAGRYIQGPPAVKYRGIFLNDEAPSLAGWAHEKYGNLNHQMYEKVFELLLRLKANYLWPAMWNNAFNEDDPLNPKLADEYGIVMGTSHHEPMLRAQQEWKRHGTGPWNYATNGEVLRRFWTEGIERNKDYESIVTIGMRGDGDMPMVEGGDMTANVNLLERIVADQRKIIADHMNPDVTGVPQVWALYKEVQEYYEHGMRVPDDVTLLWCDDNWGNLRRLPTEDERKRRGGAGIYYHFDYVGDPRSYKWLNTIPITKVWEQMNLAYRYGADRIWIVNVGDLKPMEFPMEFFLTLAWNPDQWSPEKIQEYSWMWAAREFGPEHATAIAEIISAYTKYNGRRKPELLEPTTFSLVNYREADREVAEWKSVVEKAERIYRSLPQNERDAFFELVLYPAKASAQVAELYVTAGKNQLYASQGRASTNDLAAQARMLFHADAELSDYYNHTLAHGKWDHMMDQTHIGYTFWNQPPINVMPQVAEIKSSVAGALGVAVEGLAGVWPGSAGKPELPQFDSFNRQRQYIDVFNRGTEHFQFTVTANAPWILLSQTQDSAERNPIKRGFIEKEQRLWVSVDWRKAPRGSSKGSVTIEGTGTEVTVDVEAFNPEMPARASMRGFVEANGYVSIEAEHYTKSIDAKSARWEKIPDYGRTLSSMSIFPVTAGSVIPPENSPGLEYRMYLFHAGQIKVEAILAPTLNFVPGRSLRYAISFDDQPPQIIDSLEHNSLSDWEESVSDSVRKVKSTHILPATGYHTLKFWMVDPGIVLQKLIVDLGGVKPSYLGPPESYLGAPQITSRLSNSRRSH
jgi:Glycosyl hydrolase family 115/Gylcosyl hydrolase family 115 C-terminal domain